MPRCQHSISQHTPDQARAPARARRVQPEPATNAPLVAASAHRSAWRAKTGRCRRITLARSLDARSSRHHARGRHPADRNTPSWSRDHCSPSSTTPPSLTVPAAAVDSRVGDPRRCVAWWSTLGLRPARSRIRFARTIISPTHDNNTIGRGLIRVVKTGGQPDEQTPCRRPMHTITTRYLNDRPPRTRTPPHIEAHMTR